MFGLNSKVRPAWRFETSGVLWRLVPAAGGVLIGESRDVGAKRTTFFALRETSGKPLWHGRSFGEDWWIGIEAVGSSVLFLHLFASPDLPEHKGVIAVDIPTGELLWRADELKFEWVEEGVVTLSHKTPRGDETVRVNERTGISIKEAAQPALVNSRADVKTPCLLLSPDTSSEPQARLLRSVLRDAPIVGHAEYIEQGGEVIFCYHLPASAGTGGCTQHIAVVNKAERKILRQDMLGNVPAPMPGNFLVNGTMLYYVRGRSEIIAIPLSP